MSLGSRKKSEKASNPEESIRFHYTEADGGTRSSECEPPIGYEQDAWCTSVLKGETIQTLKRRFKDDFPFKGRHYWDWKGLRLGSSMQVDLTTATKAEPLEIRMKKLSLPQIG